MRTARAHAHSAALHQQSAAKPHHDPAPRARVGSAKARSALLRKPRRA